MPAGSGFVKDVTSDSDLETSTIYMEGRETGGSPAAISILETGSHTPSDGTDPWTLLTLD